MSQEHNEVSKKYFTWLNLFLLVKLAIIAWFIAERSIGLGPDEAQYWTWSRELSWGYYSKPPGIAWEIWLGTLLFGNTELGVRFGALAIGYLLPLAVYHLARTCRLEPRTAFWSGTMMALTPLGVMASFLAITDGGAVLFWTLACASVTRGLAQEKAPNYYAVGLLILCGALFKWSIYFLWAVIIVCMPFFLALRSWHLIGGFILSLIGLFPSIAWNSTHQWATFRHVEATLFGKRVIEAAPSAGGNFFEFLGSQFALLSPIIFVLLILAFIAVCRDWGKASRPVFFCGTLSLFILVGFLTTSLFKKMQGNWCDFAYPTALVFLSWYLCEQVKWGIRWMQIGLVLSVLLCGLVFSFPLLPLPYRMNPFKHNLGWENLKQALTKDGYDPQHHFLFGDKYQMSSILSFYNEGQKRAYFLNLQGIRKNQFSYWPSMAEEQKGKTGFFVLAENAPHLGRDQERVINDYHDALQTYFRKVEFLGIAPLFEKGGHVVKGAYIFKCTDYNGLEPPEPDLY